MVGRKPRPRALAHNERKRAERCNKRGERSRVYAGLVTSTPRGLAEGGSKHLFPRVCAPAINASVKHRATRKHTRARVRGQLKESLGKWTSCRTVFLFFVRQGRWGEGRNELFKFAEFLARQRRLELFRLNRRRIVAPGSITKRISRSFNSVCFNPSKVFSLLCDRRRVCGT